MGEGRKKRGESEGCFRKISYSVIQSFIDVAVHIVDAQ